MTILGIVHRLFTKVNYYFPISLQSSYINRTNVHNRRERVIERERERERGERVRARERARERERERDREGVEEYDDSMHKEQTFEAI